MREAAILLRDLPAFRIDAFEAGLTKEGFKVARSPKRDPKPGDVLVLWNRYPEREDVARRYEAAGATVLIAENGYLGREWRDGSWYALSASHHNGAGRWPDGGPQRWDSWGLQFAPWHDAGGEVVVLAQRGFGHREVREPRGWAQEALGRLRALGVSARIRPHPGERGKARPLEQDLASASCCVTWSSGAALKALLMGVPVFHGFPKWIGAAAAKPFSNSVQEPFKGDRLPMFRRLAWAMWNLDELSSGEAFRCLGK